jgi:hypothetical protein
LTDYTPGGLLPHDPWPEERKMTDREYVMQIYQELFAKLRATIREYDLEEIGFIIAKNQNSPPLGEADGSFTVEQWQQCRDLHRLLKDMVCHEMEKEV